MLEQARTDNNRDDAGQGETSRFWQMKGSLSQDARFFLENVARKMVAVGDLTLALRDLHASPIGAPTAGDNGRLSSLKATARAASRRAERDLILKALEQTHWNRKRAARELQISYKSLLYKIKQIDAQASDSEEL